MKIHVRNFFSECVMHIIASIITFCISYVISFFVTPISLRFPWFINYFLPLIFNMIAYSITIYIYYSKWNNDKIKFIQETRESYDKKQYYINYMKTDGLLKIIYYSLFTFIGFIVLGFSGFILTIIYIPLFSIVFITGNIIIGYIVNVIFYAVLFSIIMYRIQSRWDRTRIHKNLT